VVPLAIAGLNQLEAARESSISEGTLRHYVVGTLAFQTYLKSLRLFVQYVTMRYRCFLAEFDSQEQYKLHELILEGMLQ